MDDSPPGPSVQGIFQARTLEKVAISFSTSRVAPRYWAIPLRDALAMAPVERNDGEVRRGGPFLRADSLSTLIYLTNGDTQNKQKKKSKTAKMPLTARSSDLLISRAGTWKRLPPFESKQLVTSPNPWDTYGYGQPVCRSSNSQTFGAWNPLTLLKITEDSEELLLYRFCLSVCSCISNLKLKYFKLFIVSV